MAKIVVTSDLPGGALDILRHAHDVVVLSPEGHLPADELARAVGDADALLCLLTNRVDRALLEAAPRLSVVGVCAVGYDNIDVAAATERGIVVCNTPNVLTEATADFTWALLLSAARRIVSADAYVRAGRFVGWELGAFLGRPVHGKTLGIIGLGRIGSAVARRARGFSMRVVYCQRRAASAELERELDATRLTLDELLASSDFVSVHVPLDRSTRHLLDRAAIAGMKSTAVLVNTSRGAIIDERALADALCSGALGAAGLDVFEREPEITRELLSLDNVVFAPHIASATDETRSAMARSVADDIVRVLAGETPRSQVIA